MVVLLLLLLLLLVLRQWQASLCWWGLRGHCRLSTLLLHLSSPSLASYSPVAHSLVVDSLATSSLVSLSLVAHSVALHSGPSSRPAQCTQLREEGVAVGRGSGRGSGRVLVERSGGHAMGRDRWGSGKEAVRGSVQMAVRVG